MEANEATTASIAAHNPSDCANASISEAGLVKGRARASVDLSESGVDFEAMLPSIGPHFGGRLRCAIRRIPLWTVLTYVALRTGKTNTGRLWTVRSAMSGRLPAVGLFSTRPKARIRRRI
jgi:hypothetical protein